MVVVAPSIVLLIKWLMANMSSIKSEVVSKNLLEGSLTLTTPFPEGTPATGGKVAEPTRSEEEEEGGGGGAIGGKSLDCF